MTTKLNTTDIDVFKVGPFGNLSATPVVNSAPGTGPFAEIFDQAGHLVVADVGNGSLATYTLNANGTVSPIDSVGPDRTRRAGSLRPASSSTPEMRGAHRRLDSRSHPPASSPSWVTRRPIRGPSQDRQQPTAGTSTPRRAPRGSSTSSR